MVTTANRPAAARKYAVLSAPNTQLARSHTGYEVAALSGIMPLLATDDQPYGFHRLPLYWCDEQVGTTSTGGLAARPGHKESRVNLHAHLCMHTDAVVVPSSLHRHEMQARIRDARVAQPRPLGPTPGIAHLADEIEASRSMLELEEDWDGEGSPGYEEATWRRAVDFLVGNASRLNDEYGVAIESPRIRKGPRGSIDLHWRMPDRELLVNIPADHGLPADYYGDDGNGGQQTKGTLNPERQGYHLMLWLVT